MFRRCMNSVRNCIAGSLCGCMYCGGGSRRRITEEEKIFLIDPTTKKLMERVPFVSCEVVNCPGRSVGLTASPTGVAMTSEDEIVIVEPWDRRLQIFEKNHRVISFATFANPPTLVAVHPSDDSLVLLLARHRVLQALQRYLVRYTKDIHAVPHSIDVTDPIPGNPYPIIDIAVDDDYTIFVIRKYKSSVGVFALRKEEKLISCPMLYTPLSIAVHLRNMFVLDDEGSVIRVYNYMGDLLRQIGGRNLTDSAFAVRITKTNRVLVGSYVVQNRSKKFQLTAFTADGTLLGAFKGILDHPKAQDMTVYQEDNEEAEKNTVVFCDGEKIYFYKYDLPRARKNCFPCF